MSDVHPCPICEQPTFRRVRADYAPFLKLRCELPDDTDVRARFCELCEHLFFTPYLKPEQLEKLYTDYRGEAYGKDRMSTEATYDPEHVYFEGDEQSVRRDFYKYFLSEFRDTTGVVLDFGGGDGRSARWAFPFAEIVTVDHGHEAQGVDLKALALRADFLLCAHVFEHIPEPVPVLTSMVSAMRPGAYVYIELPKEYEGRLADVFEALEGKALAGETFAPTPQERMHEHIAHFSKRSAQRLMVEAGAAPYEIHDSGLGIFGVLGVVGAPARESVWSPPRMPSRRPSIAAGSTVRFTSSKAPLGAYCGFGWRKPEGTYAWSSGRHARLFAPVAFDASGGARLTLELNPLVAPGRLAAQRVVAHASGREIGRASLASAGKADFVIPGEAFAEGTAEITLDFLDAATPKALGLALDDSLLAVQLKALTLSPLAKLRLGGLLELGVGGAGDEMLMDGWRPPEQGFVWAAAKAARLIFSVGVPQGEPFKVGFDVTPLVGGPVKAQRVIVSWNGRKLAQEAVSTRIMVWATLPAAAADQPVVLSLGFPDATALSAVIGGGDHSELAVQLHEVRLERAKPARRLPASRRKGA